MKNVIASLLAVAGLSVAANAASSLELLVSTDGINWTNNLTVAPGTHVEVLVRAHGSAPALGLASAIFQPTVSNFNPSNTVDAFTNGGVGSNTSTPPGYVADAPGQYGRISPFARTNLSTVNNITAFNNTSVGQPTGNWLRIAQKQNTAWIGGTGNTSGGSGVPIAQLANVGRTASDPAFQSSLNPDIFRFGFTVVANGGGDMLVDIPAASIVLNTNTNTRAISWWADMNESVGSIIEVPTISTALIRIPTPASLALLGMGGLAIGRRRRA